MDIDDKKERHNAFEKALGLQTPMALDDNIMAVHIGNPLISKQRKSGTQLGQDQTL